MRYRIGLVVAAVSLLAAIGVPTVATYIVRSGSMSPSLQRGDAILVLAEEEYRVGDVVTFRSDSEFVTHRVVEVVDGGYLTKGDANEDADPRVLPADHIAGRVGLRLPWVGFFLVFVRDPGGAAAALLLVGIGLLGWTVLRDAALQLDGVLR